jgi:hypothetical protein
VWDVFGPKCRSAFLGWDLTYDAIRDLYAVARQVPSAIHLDAAFFVADPVFLLGLPDWLQPALPKPIRVVLSADELLERLSEN